VTKAIEDIFRLTIPTEMLKFPTTAVTGARNGAAWTDVAAENEARLIASIDVQSAIHKSAIHLVVLQFLRDLVIDADDEASAIISNSSSNNPNAPRSPTVNGSPASIHPEPTGLFMSLPKVMQARWLGCLHASYTFAHAFNSNYDLRLALWKAGEVQTMPHLNRQETQAIATYISILFHLYRAVGDTQDETVDESFATAILGSSGLSYRVSSNVIEPLMKESTLVLERYARYLADLQKFQRDITSWVRGVVMPKPIIYDNI
jgi:hypothetical protein